MAEHLEAFRYLHYPTSIHRVNAKIQSGATCSRSSSWGLTPLPIDDDYYNDPHYNGRDRNDRNEAMDQHRGAYRTPSPGDPLQHGYQLDDNPYGHHQASQSRLDMPAPPDHRFGTPSDQLNLNAPVSPSCPLAHSSRV